MDSIGFFIYFTYQVKQQGLKELKTRIFKENKKGSSN